MPSKRYESTEVYLRIWRHLPSGTLWSTRIDTHQATGPIHLGWLSVFKRRIIYKSKKNVVLISQHMRLVGRLKSMHYTGLTTPVGWLSLLQLTVLRRSAIVV